MKLMPNSATACQLVGLLFVRLVLADQQPRKQADKVSSPMPTHDFKTGERSETFDFGGLFQISNHYNTTQLRDKLKLRKSYVKLVLKFERVSSKLKWAIKFNELEEMVRCDNLDLIRPEMNSLMECQPLAKYGKKTVTYEQQKQQSTKATYVKRRTIWLKDNFGSFSMSQVQREFILYPLNDDFAREGIRLLLKTANMTSLGFDSQKELVSSHYFELNLGDDIGCSGNIFQVVNQSHPLLRDPEDPNELPEFFDIFSHSAHQMSKHGGLLSIQDVSCGKRTGLMASFSLDIDFTLIRRLQFPFWFCSHKMTSQPISEFFDYNGQIRQVKDEHAPPNTYNSSIIINSKNIFRPASFILNQTFVITDEHTGYEGMRLVHPYFLALVHSNWTLDRFMKVLSLEGVSLFDEPASSSDLTKPDVSFMWLDEKDEEYVAFTVKTKRGPLSTLVNLFRRGFEFFAEMANEKLSVPAKMVVESKRPIRTEL